MKIITENRAATNSVITKALHNAISNNLATDCKATQMVANGMHANGYTHMYTYLCRLIILKI